MNSSRLTHFFSSARMALPEGHTLPQRDWERRHRVLVALLWCHALGIAVFGIARGEAPGHVLLHGLVIAAFAAAASLDAGPRRLREAFVALGLLTSSALLVHVWDGQVEAHFHFFVVIVLLTLYEGWVPFLVALGYVAVHHGLVGTFEPHSVFNHQAAVDHPRTWALVHALFVMAAGAGGVAGWRLNERTRLEARAAYEQARDSEERFRSSFENAGIGMALVALDGSFLRVNSSLSRITGYPEEELVELSFQAITHPDDLEQDLEAVARMLRGEVDTHQAQKRYVHAYGHAIWVQVTASVIRDRLGAPLYFVSHVEDITERKHAVEELAHQALHDPLTDLPNRTLFLDRLEHALSRLARTPWAVGVLFLDLDRFKLVNDSLGHDAGDLLLTLVAARLKDAVRPSDTVARFGGDEFTVLCEDLLGQEDAIAVADRLAASLTPPFEVDGQEVFLTASIGIALGSGGGEKPRAHSLLRDADTAMYLAKERGKSRHEIFDSALRSRAAERLETEAALRRAIEHGELRVYYQPEVDLASGRIVGVEALVRWLHPQRGFVQPADFIEIAEETGLILPLGEVVLHTACSDVEAWRKSGAVAGDFGLALNLSARQLAHPGLVEEVATALEATGVPAKVLCLEITEGTIISDLAATIATLHQLKALGVRIAIDDFGCGISSLSHIRRLPPVDVLKIDRAFVSGLGASKRDTAIVASVISLAHALGASAVAEGVEHAEHAAELRTMGCDIAQGFYFGHAQSAQALEETLAAAPAITGESSVFSRRSSGTDPTVLS